MKSMKTTTPDRIRTHSRARKSWNPYISKGIIKVVYNIFKKQPQTRIETAPGLENIEIIIYLKGIIKKSIKKQPQTRFETDPRA